jgi:hypothetical protein
MTTRAEIEAAARAAHRVASGSAGTVGAWEDLPEEERKSWLDVASAALDAAERVRELVNDNSGTRGKRASKGHSDAVRCSG